MLTLKSDLANDRGGKSEDINHDLPQFLAHLLQKQTDLIAKTEAFKYNDDIRKQVIGRFS